MTGQHFESVAEARRLARRRLPRSVYKALWAGTEEGRTLTDNVEAFGQLGFVPKIAGLPSRRDLTTRVLGRELAIPVMTSPTGTQAVHPDGELAVARATAAAGTAIGLSSFSSRTVEEVVAANPKTYFQLYWAGTREEMLHRVRRARSAGVAGLIVTLDWSQSHSRDWGTPAVPERLDPRTILRFAPEGLARPRWLSRWARAGTLPPLLVPNMVTPAMPEPTFASAYEQCMITPAPSWDDLAWLREQWDGPFMLKGVMRVEDALSAADAGYSAISVSNHGGNNLDGTPASIRALPGIAAAVGDRVEVLLDSGIRRGGDVAKALALGASAVMIGRAYLWGLGANGQAGVENVLEVLREGLDSALIGNCRAAAKDLCAADVLVPPGFEMASASRP